MNLKEKRELLKLLDAKAKIQAKKGFEPFAKECIKIVDKKGNTVPLVLNNAQRKIRDTIKELRAQGIPPRIVVLKARQVGASTGTQADMLHKCSQNNNKAGMIIAHDEDAVSSIFGKVKFAYDHLPEWAKPLQKASNAKELIFDRPYHYKGKEKGLNSKIRVRIAGKSGIGRGDTPIYVHCSEYAFWSGTGTNSPSKQLMGILQAVPEETNTWLIVESTANGYNDFKDLWDGAVSGSNGFTPIFFSWHDHEEYIRPFNNEKEKDRFLETMSEYESEVLLQTLKLPLERINWWRHTFIHKCYSNLSYMKQENPSTPEEAFLMSGRPVFDTEIIMKRIETLREKYKDKPYKEGYFEYEWNDKEWKDYIKNDTIKFVESKTKKWIRIYKEPEEDTPYVLAGDTKGEGKDYFAGTLADNISQERVATLHMQVSNSKPYTWQMYCLGKYYNKALIGIEMNFNTAPLEELERLRYSNQYVRERTDTYSGKLQKKFGWKTDGITRPSMIDDEITLVEDYIHLINDIPTLHEMLTFVYNEENRPDAMSGAHDDLLISDCIVNKIRDQQDMVKVKTSKYNWESLPEDLKQDYYSANEQGKQYLMNKWKREGLI